MEKIAENPILKFHDDTFVVVRSNIGMHEAGSMKEAVSILDDWVKKQAHFVKKDFSKEYLELLLVTTKGSVERAKQRLDKLCTLKTLMPDFFADVMDVHKVIDQHAIVNAHLPTLTQEHNRIYLLKIILDNFDSNTVSQYSKYSVLLAEYLRKSDYSNRYILITDFRGNSNMMKIMTKINPVELRQTMTLMIEGYGLLIKGIHIISESKMVDTIISLFKQIVSAKLANRIHVHKDLDTVYDFVPKDLFPVEYGGKEAPLNELQKKWIDVLTSKDNMEYYKDMYKACTNESYRQTDSFTENYTGMAGSFKALSVD